VLARMGKMRGRKLRCNAAIEVAQTSGDLEGAGRTPPQHHRRACPQISVDEVVSNYKAALDSFGGFAGPAATKRLISCAQKVIGTLKMADDRECRLGRGVRNGRSWTAFVQAGGARTMKKAIISAPSGHRRRRNQGLRDFWLQPSSELDCSNQ